MRAVSADSDAAQLMGINVNRTISFTFALGSALAGAGGVLIGLYYNSDRALMGTHQGSKPLSQPFLRNRNHSRSAPRWILELSVCWNPCHSDRIFLGLP